MVELGTRTGANGSNGTNATNGRTIDGSPLAHDAEMAWREAQGASQIGPFDYVPPMGFREYWYPAVFKKDVGTKKPVFVKMLGEDIVFFRGKADKVYALFDWCPHRSARLSQGESLFPGTITCEYHGYTFNGEGECVAGLIDSPNTPVVGKMKGRSYPTDEHDGVVYVWMGETEPVPLAEDLPPEIVDSRNHSYKHVSEWDANWTEPVNQGIDYHEAYLHRKTFNYMGGWTQPWKFKFHGLLSKELPFFRPRVANYGGIKIVHEDEKRVCSNPVNVAYGEDFHPGVNASWPRKRWYMFLPKRVRKTFSLMGADGASLLGIPSFSHGVELPSKIRTGSGSEKPAISLHMRWMVPVTLETCRVWTYTIGREPKTILGKAYKKLWYHLWRKPNTITRINEWEDLVTFQKDRLRYDLPQKLSTLDTVVIYFRRHLAQRSRDFQRLGGAYGSNHPPTKGAGLHQVATAFEQREMVGIEGGDC
ncbi:MAG: Rieske 2Fe-2S domain-containing protein [Dehalococcoidia bacterium]|nr:Rieske 2Fe-2S domain-containing protein [Dehalococcoidia bacterium]